MLERDENPAVDAPIPGQSLTAPLGDRPWQRPARFSTPDEALSYYIERITVPRNANQMFDVLEMGIPIATLVDIMQTGGVMEGLHSLDVGVVISPALTEAIEGMAKAAEIDYTVIGKDPKDLHPDDSQISLAMKSLAKEKVEESGVMEEIVQEEPQEQPKGLMARRVTDGN